MCRRSNRPQWNEIKIAKSVKFKASLLIIKISAVLVREKKKNELSIFYTNISKSISSIIYVITG